MDIRYTVWTLLILFVLSLEGIGTAAENNFLNNGGFEDAPLCGWELPGPAAGSCERDTAVKHGGAASLKVTSAREAGVTVRQVLPSGVKGDVKVEAFVMLSGEYNGAQPKIVLVCELASGKTSPFTIRCKAEREKWNKTEEVISLPEGVKRITLCFSVTGDRGQVWLDDVTVTKADTSYQLLE